MASLDGLTIKVLHTLQSKEKVIAYFKEAQRQKMKAHKLKHQHDGLCQPLTDKEWKQIKTKMKSSYGGKAKQYSRNKLWKHHDEPISRASGAIHGTL